MAVYGPQNISGEQISRFVSQNLGNAQAIADAAQQFGISAADIEAAAGYTPQQQATYFSSAGVSEPGIAGLTPVTYGGDNQFTIKDVRDYVSANLQDPGQVARRMQETGVTQQDLESIFQGTYTPTQISSYLSSPQAKLYGPAESPLTGTELVDYFATNLNDPTRSTQFAKSLGLTTEDIYNLGQMYAPGMNLTQAGIEDYLTRGREGFRSAYADIAQNVFGSPEEISQIADLVYASYQRQIANNPNLTAAQKQEALAKTRDEVIGQAYGPEKFAEKSLEDIEGILRTSGANKYQEALRLSNIASKTLGYSKEDAQALITKAMSGTGLTEPEQKIFDTLMQKHDLSNQDTNNLLMYAASTNPEAPIFKDNPQLLKFYTPIGEPRSSATMVNNAGQDTGRGRSGQYGTHEGMPLLNANVMQQAVGTHGALRTPSGEIRSLLEQQISPYLGLDFHSWTESTNLLGGNSIVGVNFDKQYIKDLERFENAINSGQIRAVSDESGTGYYRAVRNPNYRGGDDPEFTYEVISRPAPKAKDNTLAGQYQAGYLDAPTSMQDLQGKLISAANTLGISTKDKDLGELFDEISSKTEGLYQLTGSAINAGMADDNGKYTDTMTLKESRDKLNTQNKNHFSALYRQVGDKLVPVETKFFDFEPPKKGRFGPIGGFVGEMLSGIASVPFIAELTLATPLAPYYPAIKAIQVGGLTGDLDEGLKAGAKAWIMRQGVQMADVAIGDALIDSGMTDISTVNALSNLGANVASNMGIAALNGESVTDAGVAALVMSALSAGTKGAAKELNIPTQYQPVVAQLLTDAILKQDMEKSLTNLALKTVGNEVKDLLKETKKETASA